jgi:hypothetical protein
MQIAAFGALMLMGASLGMAHPAGAQSDPPNAIESASAPDRLTNPRTAPEATQRTAPEATLSAVVEQFLVPSETQVAIPLVPQGPNTAASSGDSAAAPVDAATRK